MEVKKRFYFAKFISIFILFLISILGFSFISAEFNNCWQYSGTNSSACISFGGDCVWKTQAQDPFCMNSAGCCMDKGCGLFAGTNESWCETDNPYAEELSCMWDPWMTIWYPNGTQGSSGGCVMNWETNNQSWSGVSTGCWSYDGNKATCNAQSGTCKWAANDQNQDPYCYIKSLSDAQNKNPLATTIDIGCCQNIGCWNYDNNATACLSALQGNCFYSNNTYGGGWCNTKSCSEITTQANCTYAKQILMMPCNWNNDSQICSSDTYGMGGFGFFNNTDSCFSAGGWYNSTGSCVMPTGGFSGGSGGFMFVGEAHCWFADNKPDVCRNISGCAYCVAGDGANGISNSSSNNICYNKQIGFCEGHNSFELNIYANANNTANLACGDIRVKSACEFGPLPNCKWTNSSINLGNFCEVGTSGQKSAPPAQYCEDPLAKNNYTLCMQLANDYMMPCKWQNTTVPYQNCTFNNNAVFGGGGEMDFGIINNQFSCTAAGGTWQTEYYVDENILKQDSWCEMTGLFDIDQGKGMNNKGNCDTNCWACEFQSNGSAWSNVAEAEAACSGSALGLCKWINDSEGTKSFNKLGWCDYPKEMESGGAKDCNFECEGCNFMINPQSSCEGSMANNGTGCKWVNDTNNLKGGFCVDKTKKTCSSDCFSCYDTSSCSESNLNCNWDPTFNLCKPQGFSGEICFNGVDDDSDILVDCSDPDCGFDNFCGGSSFGGNCFAQTTQGICNSTLAFGNNTCVWINDTWNPNGWCDMPGANCWKFNDDLVACGITPGCTNNSISMGGNAWCEMNNTMMDSATCWNKYNESSCSGSCRWKNNSWGIGGWCEYSPMATCMDLNSSTCSLNSNCTWRQDSYSMMGGWCEVACMNPNLDQAGCNDASLNGLCQWKNMSQTCQPSTFMMMGMPSSGGGMGGGGGFIGGMGGCGQYGGNQTGCLANSICNYKNDSYAMNNKSAEEPSGWCMDKSEFQYFGDIGIGGGIVILGEDYNNSVNISNPFDVLPETGVSGGVDILRFGMKISDSGFNFGAELYDINESIVCNGYTIKGPMGGIPYIGSGLETGKYYWYLDTDGNSSNGCLAIGTDGNYSGYEFLISYVSRNSNSSVVETKQLMRCYNNTWNPTNAELTTSKKMSCGEIEGVMLAVSKQDLESFSQYNKTAIMKVFISSANDSDSRISPSDSVGPGYYTPGAIDFGFVDCSNPLNVNDPKCKNFKKFGFNVFEECKNNIDDDENGLIDCDDPFCKFIPDCNNGVGFSFVIDNNDKVAPIVMFSNVEKLYDAAFIRIDTSEPSNLSLDFYKNDSTCTTRNITLTDIGSDYQVYANFKPFHTLDLIQDNLGYSLNNGTNYYYKITVCDPSNNCAVSACSNFTTKISISDPSFIFKIELPPNYTIDIPAFNKTNYNFTEVFGDSVYEVGIKTNTSVTKNMNFTIHCQDMAIGFFGINILDPTKIDLSNAFVCDGARDLIGMNSSLKKWNKLISDLHLGGAADYIEITIPVAYSASNTFNWTDDSGSSGQDVDDYVECYGNTTQTTCRVPVSMGFSAYTVTVPSSGNEESNVGGTNGGGGGGGGSDVVKPATYTITEAQLAEGYAKWFIKNDRLKFSINNEEHYMGLEGFTANVAMINVSSIPQRATLAIGEEKKFELTNDNFFDISIKLNSINLTSNKTSLTIKKINESTGGAGITGEIVNGDMGESGVGEEILTQADSEGNEIKFWVWYIVIGVIVLMAIVYGVYSHSKKKKMFLGHR